MKIPAKRVASWAALFLGCMALAHVIAPSFPRESRITIGLPVNTTVEAVRLEIARVDGEVLRTVELRPPFTRARQVEYVVALPPDEYRIETEYELRPADKHDKSHGGGWTRMGVQHQIRLEGEAHHFPPPEHEAK